MKKRKFLLVFVSSLLLSGCEFLDNIFGPHSTVDPSQKTEDVDDPPIVEDDNKVGEFYGGLVNDQFHSGYEFSASSEPINKPTTGEGEIKIYSFNDFHGAILETDDEPGLKAFASYYKEKSKEDNTLIFDQGDTWQGSLESNYCYGEIIQDVFNFANISLRTVGNHDFDWGLERLKEVTSRRLDEDYIPALAANVYDYENGVTGTTQQGQFGKEYATFLLENGIKVGVVGVIGQLTSSICSNRIETVNFTSPLSKIKEMSDYLRVKKNCDIVIASTHNAVGYFYDKDLTSISPVSNKRYVDLVLGGHEHTRDYYEDHGVVFSQSDSNGKSSAITTLTYDFENDCLKEETDYQIVERSDYYYYSTNVDPTIDKMVDDYLETVESIGDEVLSTHFSGYYNTSRLATLMSEAIFEKVRGLGIDVDYSVTNNARESFYGNVFTYRDLYRCFPFDNEIVLMEVSKDGNHEGYRPSKYGAVDPNKDIYNIAAIDYVALHQNSYREYDNYPDSVVRSRTMLKGQNDTMITYRDILREFLLDNPNRDFAASNIN